MSHFTYNCVYSRPCYSKIGYLESPDYLEFPVISTRKPFPLVDVATLFTAGCLKLPLSRTSFNFPLRVHDSRSLP